MGILSALLGACMGNNGNSDADYAEKYKSAVASLEHVESVESSYKTDTGMGRTANLDIRADTSDNAEMMALLKEALPAVVNAADGDPNVSLDLQITSADGATAVSPTHLGYSGTGTLNSYRDFLKDNPQGAGQEGKG